MVAFAGGEFARREVHRRGSISGVYLGAARATAVALELAACDPYRRPDRPHRRRFSYSLLQPDWRLHPFVDRYRCRALHGDCILLRRVATLAANALRVLVRPE